MKNIFHRLTPGPTHLSDETLSLLASGELKTAAEVRAHAHLANCWQCRTRRDAFEKAALQVVHFRNSRLASELPMDARRTDSFIRQLDLLLREADTTSFWSRTSLHLSSFQLPTLNPVFIGAGALALIGLLLLSSWQHPVQTVSAKELLQRAVISERTDSVMAPGVRYSRVRIDSPHFTLERELYRDNQGLRHRHSEARQQVSEEVRGTLSSVGIDWSAPLSAESYLAWHDSQTSASDSVSETSGMLTLVTRVGDGEVSQQSITVRASDFHTVARRVDMHSYGTIEISESNYAVLDWNGINSDLFDSPTASHSASPATHPALPPLSSPVTDAELDHAELDVRFVLNRLHADEGEPISIVRADHRVEVQGVVDTSQRRQEIIDALRLVPHVTPEILSNSEVRSARSNGSVSRPTRVESVDPPESPLETYLISQHEEKLLVDDASHTLIDEALKVERNADALKAVNKYLTSVRPSSQDTNAAVLSRTYRDRLSTALDSEDAALQQLGFYETNSVQSSPTPVDLIDESQHNNALCLELVTGNAPGARSAPEIVTGIRASVARIRSALLERDMSTGKARTPEMQLEPH